MSVRPLSKQEDDAAKSLPTLGMITRREWMAVFDVNGTTPITYRTDMLPDRTDPDQAVLDHWAKGGSVIIHHNHPSDESLSFADWNTLINFSVDEIFAHTIDGSIFYGKLIDRMGAAAALLNYDVAGNEGENVLIAAAPGHPQALGPLAGFLRKHVVALALAMKRYVDYQFTPGPIWQAVLSLNGMHISAAANAAAAKL